MMKKLNGNSLAGFSNNRVENDFYATDPKSVKDLIDAHFDDYNDASVWEPAAGMGHISNSIEPHFANVYSSDLIDRGCGYDTFDFLGYRGDKKVDWVITNPPFKHAQEFIEKSLDVANIGVAMFLKIQFLEGKKRKELFKNTPLKHVYVFSARQTIFTGGEEFDEKGKRRANTMCFAWFVWEKGYEGRPMIGWI